MSIAICFKLCITEHFVKINVNPILISESWYDIKKCKGDVFMKIGVMGIGNIFTKAYLPVLSQKQDIEWHFYSRDKNKLDMLEKQHGFKHLFSDKEAFFNSGLDGIMIHTPTFTHYELIKECLMRGLHVFVDKPISDQILQTYELIQLANDLELILMPGFNRRYAPHTQSLKEIEDKTMIVVRKNRTSALQEPRFALYDMMIHVVDTALYLLDGPVLDYTTKLQLDDQNHVLSAVLNISTSHSVLIAYMNMQSGSRLETFEVMSPKVHAIVQDMNTLNHHYDAHQEIHQFSDWTPTLDRRGFPQMIDTFINKIHRKDFSDNNTAILSHEIIEDLLK